jgi:hemoglobin/transferrin/lactoferrin receptor protein
MRYILSLLFVFSIFYFSKSQTLVIKDRLTHQPLELVTIHSDQPNISISTNAKGEADISEFKQSKEIHIRLMGYYYLLMSYEELKNQGYVIYLNPRFYMLNTAVISATRWEQEKVDLPYKISSVKVQDIVLQNPQTAADLLASTGEVYVQKSQLGGGSPMIRGFATNRVLLSVDGVRMNNAIFRTGNVQNVISIDPLSIENSEVLFGPGSVIYGSDAIGGVMSFKTLEPKFSSSDSAMVKGSVLGRYSSANEEKTGHFDMNIGFKKAAFVTSLTYSSFEDLKMGSHGPDDYLRYKYVQRINGQDIVVANDDPKIQRITGYNQINFLQKAAFKLTDSSTLKLGFYYSTTSDYNRYDRLTQFSGGTLKYGDWYYGPQEWLMTVMDYEVLKPSKIYDKFNVILSYQSFEESRHNRKLNETDIAHRTEQLGASALNVDFSKELDTSNVLFYGIEAVINILNSEGIEENIISGKTKEIDSRYPDGSNWNSYAAYLSYRYTKCQKLTLQSGLRYNYITTFAEFDTTLFSLPFTEAELKNHSLIGSAGLAIKPKETWQINFNLSTAFRAPNIDDIGKVFDSEPGSVVVPNPDLEPEYAYNAEFSIAKTFDERIKFELATFYTYLNKALVRRDFLLDGKDSIMYDGEMSKVQAIQNASYAEVYGFQGNIDVQLIDKLRLVSKFTYQKGEEETDDGKTTSLRHAGPWFGSTHLIYNMERLKIDFYTIYNGEISYNNLTISERDKEYYALDNNGNPYAPAWYTINIKVVYTLTDYLLLNAGVENIGDIRYRPYSSGISAPGRNFIISARATF